MHYSLDELRAIFDAATLERGRAYAREARAKSIRINAGGELISALVQGARAQAYRCIINLDRGGRGVLRVKGQCTCPMVYNCKHVVAVLIEAAQPQASSSHAALPVSSNLDYLTGEWLREITAAGAPVGAYPRGVNERLLYVLSLDEWATGLPRLRVELQKVRVLKDGGYGQANPYQLNAYSSAQFIQPADTAIMHQLAAARSPSARIELAGAWGAQALRAMLETGRTHWRDKGNPALALAAPRQAALAWREGEAGQQRLSMDIRAVILPLSPPWYIDTETGQCGPLETGLGDALAGALVAGPALDAEQLAVVLPRLSALVPTASLPLPKTIQVLHRADIKPVPHLSLGSARVALPRHLRMQWHKDEIWEDYARLCFDYAGVAVDCTDPATNVNQKSEGELLIIARNRTTEGQALGVLANLRFAPLSGLQGSAQEGVPEGSFFHLDQEQGWLDFIMDHLPRLREQGWVVEIAPSFRFHLTEPEAWHADIEEGNDWFSLGLGIEVEGRRIELLPLLARLISEMPGACARYCAWIGLPARNCSMPRPTPPGNGTAAPSCDRISKTASTGCNSCAHTI